MSEHELWNELGNLYFMCGSYKQAIHAYERSIQADTNFGRPYSNLALAYVQQGKYEEAVELYRRSIELLVEDKEKAISWNRLGTVYRHLKDYSHAVIAFQEADLLDPHSADDFPATTEARQQVSEPPSSVLDDPLPEAGQDTPADEPPAAEPPLEITQTELSLGGPEPLAEPDASPAEAEPGTAAALDGEPELEWWDVDEERIQSATARQPAAPDSPNTSWTHADPSQFQQDLSQMPETGSLTTWGDAEFDDDFEFYPSTGAESDEDLPDPDDGKMSTWIPLPEVPLNLDEVWIPPFVEEEEPEPDFPLEWNEAPAYHMLNSTDFGTAPASNPAVPEPAEYLRRSEPIPVREAGVQQAWDRLELDVVVEERPASDVAPGTYQSPKPAEPPVVQAALEQTVTEPEATPEVPMAQGMVEQQLPQAEPILESQAAQEAFEQDLVVEPEAALESPATPDMIAQEIVELQALQEAFEQDIVVEAEAALEPPSAEEAFEHDIVVEAEAGLKPPSNPETCEQDVVVEAEAALEPLPAQEAFEQDIVVQPLVEQEAPVQEAVQEPPLAEPSVNAQPPALPDCERSEDEMREIEMGIAKFRRVVQVNPRNAHAWDALGTLYKSAGLYKDAILAYQQAISNDSSKSLYYHHLGLVYACEGRDEDAIGAFQHVLEIDPEYSLAHATLGGYYRKMGLEELAQKHIGKAMKNIFDSENEYNRACLEAICGNADQAIELLGVALKNKQTYVDWILRDPDLDFIRQDPRFKQLISDYTR